MRICDETAREYLHPGRFGMPSAEEVQTLAADLLDARRERDEARVWTEDRLRDLSAALGREWAPGLDLAELARKSVAERGEARAALRLVMAVVEMDAPDYECGHGMPAASCDEPECETRRVVIAARKAVAERDDARADAAFVTERLDRGARQYKAMEQRAHRAEEALRLWKRYVQSGGCGGHGIDLSTMFVEATLATSKALGEDNR